jgi:putative ABC transport system permease protein
VHADLVHALRSFRRRPLFSAVAAGTLALAIGASTAVFSVVDAVLLRSLPFAAAHELVTVWLAVPEQNAPFVEVSYPFLTAVRRDSRTLAGAAAMPAVNSPFLLGHGADTARVEGRIVTGNFFAVLGARAALGRTFTEAEDKVGVPRVVVVSHGLWQRHFGGDPSAVGRELRVDGTPMTVVGVMPRAFRYPPGADLWTPLVPIVPNLVNDARVGWATILARRAPDQTLAAVRAELDRIAAHHGWLRDGPDAAPVHPVPRSVVTPLRDTFFGASRPALLVLLLAVLLVLLVASANVAALLLARAGARRREIAVRLALGASRARLVRQLLAESAVLAGAGGTAGVALAYLALDALVALVPADVPRLGDAAVDARVLVFACALTLVSATVAGLVPALLASRPALTEALGAGARDAGPHRHGRWRGLLLGAEAAIAVVLLSGAALLVQTFSNLQRLDLGFDPAGVLTFEVTGPRGKYTSPAQVRALHHTIVERLGAVPGVESAAAVLIRPLWGRVGLDWPFTVEGQAKDEAERNPPLNLQVVTPEFFRTMRMPLVRGRSFSDRDTERTPPVVVISEPMARRYWPGQDPLGKRLQMPAPTAPYPLIWVTVIGVVPEARYRELQAARYDLYMSYRQSDEPLKHVVLRTAQDPLALAGAAREAVRAADAELVLSHVTTMEDLVDDALAGTRFAMQLLSGFALVALALAALGTYGVVAFLVGRRTREIGLRMALGARAASVVRLVVRQGMAPVAAGALLGVAGAFALGRALSALLYGVSAHDATAPSVAAALLCAAGLFACALPARRAARVDPAIALREE